MLTAFLTPVMIKEKFTYPGSKSHKEDLPTPIFNALIKCARVTLKNHPMTIDEFKARIRYKFSSWKIYEVPTYRRLAHSRRLYNALSPSIFQKSNKKQKPTKDHDDSNFTENINDNSGNTSRLNESTSIQTATGGFTASRQDSTAATLDASSGASGMLFTVRQESTNRPPAPPDHLTDFSPAGKGQVNGPPEMSIDDFLNAGKEDDYVLSSSESSAEDD